MRLDGIGIQHCSHIAQYTQYAADNMSKHNDKIKMVIIVNLEVSKSTKLLCMCISLGTFNMAN